MGYIKDLHITQMNQGMLSLYKDVNNHTHDLAKLVADQNCEFCGGIGYITVNTIKNGEHDEFETTCECLNRSSFYDHKDTSDEYRDNEL